MRIVHTSDWHLGHQLHGVARDREHAAFLGWLVELCAAEQVDAIVVTGDVFDGSNPPAVAQAAYYGFLAEVATRLPGVQVVVIGGNHDSPARLEAPAPLLERLRVRVVGALPRAAADPSVVDERSESMGDGGPAGFARGAGGKAPCGIDWDRAIVPLFRRATGELAAWLVAIPFLRIGDLATTRLDDADAAMRAIYAEGAAAARARCGDGQALVVTGHLHVSGAQPSEMSERRIVVGGAEAIGGDLFPADATYVALGHLHKAQRIGGREHVRYAGSPIPLAMGEADYRHTVVIADLAGAACAVRTVAVPRTVEMVRVPRRDAAPIEEVLAALAALPPQDPDEPQELRPFLEVHVRLDRPVPGLRDRIEQAIDGKRPRLVKIGVQRAGDLAALGDAAPGTALADLAPREVVIRRWRRDHQGEPPPALLAAFDALLAQVLEEGA